MRGRSKSLKPLLTPILVRAMRQRDPATAGLLCLWYVDQYNIMVDVMDSTDSDNAATPRQIAAALDAAPWPDTPPPGVAEDVLVLIRGEAQDLVEAAIETTLARRESKRRQRAAQAAADAVSVVAPVSAVSAVSATTETTETTATTETTETTETRAVSPVSHRVSQSVNQRAPARARTTHAWGSEDYRAAASAAGIEGPELERLVAYNERGLVEPAEAVRLWLAHRTPTEAAGGASAVQLARDRAASREARARIGEQRAAEERRHRDAVARLLDGATSAADIQARGYEPGYLVRDVEDAVAAYLDQHPEQEQP